MEISNKSTFISIFYIRQRFFWQQYPHNSSFASNAVDFQTVLIAV